MKNQPTLTSNLIIANTSTTNINKTIITTKTTANQKNTNLALLNTNTSLAITNNLLGVTQEVVLQDWQWWYSLNHEWRIILLKALNIAKNKHQKYLDKWHDKDAMSHTLQHLLKLKNLHIKAENISNFSPVTYLTNLNSLDLSQNLIYDLTGLVKLRNLTSVNLENNQIHDISPLSHLKGLSQINLRYNHLISSDINWLQCHLPNCLITSNAIEDGHNSINLNRHTPSIFDSNLSSFL